jgi:hypothetical protein
VLTAASSFLFFFDKGIPSYFLTNYLRCDIVFILLPLEHRESTKRFVSLQFILQTVGRSPWAGYQPVARPLPTQTTQTNNKRRQTSMPPARFELTTPVFQRAKTVYALNCETTVIGDITLCSKIYRSFSVFLILFLLTLLLHFLPVYFMFLLFLAHSFIVRSFYNPTVKQYIYFTTC